MKLSKRVLMYSGILMVIVVLCFLVYATLFLPKLHDEAVLKRYDEETIRIHEQFLDEGSYEKIKPLNPSSTVTWVLLKNKNEVRGYHNDGEIKINLEDEKLIGIYQKWMKYVEQKLENPSKEIESPFEKEEEVFATLSQEIKKKFPINFDIVQYQKTEDIPMRNSEVRRVNSRMLLLSLNSSDASGKYVIDVGISNLKDRMVVTYIPAVVPAMNQLLPVVLSSIPMVCIVLAIIVFLGSMIFKKSITDPIEQLAKKYEKG